MTMNTSHTLGAVGVAFVGVVGVAIATMDDDNPAPARTSCSFMVGDHGSFISDGDKVCELVFSAPRAKAPTCRLWPTVDSSISYQWSYNVTPSGVLVHGLKSGAAIAFDCGGRSP
jgi:hypothetical protein